MSTGDQPIASYRLGPCLDLHREARRLLELAEARCIQRPDDAGEREALERIRALVSRLELRLQQLRSTLNR